MRRRAAGLSCAFYALACACEEVPTLTFAQEDAAPEAAQTSSDAGGLLAIDASADAGCPGANPQAAPFVCCGSVACEGQCAGQCEVCVSKCTTPGDVCCAKTNNVVCLSAGSICH